MITRTNPRHSFTHATRLVSAAILIAGLASVLAIPRPADASPVMGRQLAGQLRSGGYVIVMRHAQSPLARPRPGKAAPGNVRRERQLSAAGKATAREIGTALHALRIPIGRIYSSPTFRARQTLRLAGLGPPTLVSQLGEGARGMAAPVRHARAEWLRRAVRRAPLAGTNTLIVTHTPNIVGAFGRAASHTHAAEMLVFKPMAGHGARLIGRIRAAVWRKLAHSLHHAKLRKRA